VGAPVFVSEREPNLQKLVATEDRAAIRVGANLFNKLSEKIGQAEDVDQK
jgi:hypothetical protein